MRISRFYIDPESYAIPPVGERFDLPGPVAHHLVGVLRASVDSELILFDGTGGEYHARVTSINKKSATVIIESHENVNRESTINIILAQALATGSKMDTVIQKAVELGVSKIIPVITERCTVNLKDKRAEARHQHWLGVIQSACEQCGRTQLPAIEKTTKLFPWSTDLDNNLIKLVMQPDGQLKISELNVLNKPVLILIGPEGGFSESELSRLSQSGFQNISLGKRVLRTETAGLAALASIQTLWGDYQ